MTSKQTGVDPRELPAYAIAEAAHYLRIPSATLRSWVFGRYYLTERGRRFFKPLIELPDANLPSLSFINLVEAHVLDSSKQRHASLVRCGLNLRIPPAGFTLSALGSRAESLRRSGTFVFRGRLDTALSAK